MFRKKSERSTVPRRDRGLKFWFLTILAASAVLGILISALLPLGIQWGIKRVLTEMGAQSVQVENVDFNAFTGRIVIFGLEFNGPDQGSLSLDRVIVDLDHMPVWKKRIRARHVSVIGLTFDVLQPEGEGLAVGGFPLNFPAAEEKSQEDDNGEGGMWGMGVGMLDLDDIHVRFSALGFKEEITLDRAQISDFHTWDSEKTGKLDISFMFNGGGIHIVGEAEPFGRRPGVSAELKVGEMPLDWLIPYLTSDDVRREVGKKPLHSLIPQLQDYDIKTLSGELWVRSRLNIQYDPSTGGRTVSVKSSTNLKNLDVTGSLASIPVRYTERQFFIDSDLDYRDEGIFEPGNIRITASSSIEGMSLDSVETGRNILSVGLYRLSGMKEAGTDLAEAQSLNLQDVRALEGDSGAHAINVKEIAVEDVRFSDLNRLEVAQVAITGLDNLIELNSEGEINLVSTLEELLPEPQGDLKDTNADSAPDQSPVTLKVDRISISQGSGIRTRDESVDPPIELNLNPLELEITDLDSAKPGNPSSLTMTAMLGKYSNLEISGTVKPFAAKPTMDLKATIRSLDLPQMSPYSKKNIGHLVKSGHLDADIDWRMDQGNIDSQVALLLRKLRLEAIDQKDDEEFSQKLEIPFPVSTGLALLEDKNDNISLKLPITGNIENPDFQLRSVVYKAIGKAMTTGAVGYFGPLGLQLVLNVALPPGTVFLAGALTGELTKLRFDPVQFPPLQYQVTEENSQYLDKVVQLIQDRPGLELILCGISTDQDLAEHRKSTAQTTDPAPVKELNRDPSPSEAEGPKGLADGGSAVEELPISPEERSVLQGIAKSRALTVKDYLVEHGVDPGRLIICFSEFEQTPGSIPRVEIAL